MNADPIIIKTSHNIGLMKEKFSGNGITALKTIPIPIPIKNNPD